MNQEQTLEITDEDSYEDVFGDEVIVTKVGHVSIVHVDRPSKATIKRRVNEVIREELTGRGFEEGYPLCEQLKESPYDVVYFKP